MTTEPKPEVEYSFRTVATGLLCATLCFASMVFFIGGGIQYLAMNNIQRAELWGNSALVAFGLSVLTALVAAKFYAIDEEESKRAPSVGGD